MPSKFSARWLLPVAGPVIDHGWVAIERGRIAGAGSGHPLDAHDLGRRVILPALVNAHTHLELSYLHREIPPAARFTDWVRPLLARRRVATDAAVIREAAEHALDAATRAGTGLFGDVSNTLVTVGIFEAAGVPAHVFYELLGFNAPDPVGRVQAARAQADASAVATSSVRVGLAPHAPYSVSPGLFDAIRRDLDAHPGSISTVHLAESPEEVELLRHGSGPWRGLLEELGVWDERWTPPGVSPVAYMLDRPFLDPLVLLVHGVQCGAGDIARLAAAGVTVVCCPRSNRYVGVGSPPLAAFFDAGVPVAFGTDSLASVEDLNMFTELAEARRLAPDLPPGRFVESATRVGARALGFDADYGTIEPGKRAALITVRVPDGVTDVEEYLLSGVRPEDVAWLDGPATETARRVGHD